MGTYSPLGFFPESADAQAVPLKLAASQTISKGDAVIWSSGLVAIAVAGSARILGVAAEAATTNASGVRTDTYASGKAQTHILVYGVKNPNEVFLGCFDADSSSITAGTEPDLVGATGAMYLDTDASSTDVFKVLGPVEGETLTAARARWRFVINKSDVDPID